MLRSIPLPKKKKKTPVVKKVIITEIKRPNCTANIVNNANGCIADVILSLGQRYLGHTSSSIYPFIHSLKAFDTWLLNSQRDWNILSVVAVVESPLRLFLVTMVHRRANRITQKQKGIHRSARAPEQQPSFMHQAPENYRQPIFPKTSAPHLTGISIHRHLSTPLSGIIMASGAMAPNAANPKNPLMPWNASEINIKEPDFHLTDLCYRNVMANPTSLAVGNSIKRLSKHISQLSLWCISSTKPQQPDSPNPTLTNQELYQGHRKLLSRRQVLTGTYGIFSLSCRGQ